MQGLFKKSFEKPSDLLCCAFGLQSSEIDTYFALLSRSKTAEEISSDLGLDRSTVQRALKSLLQKQLVLREMRHIQRGGYYYVYSALSTNEVRKQILDELDLWYRETRRFLLGEWPEGSV
jgi:predicted transcriptional regulator